MKKNGLKKFLTFLLIILAVMVIPNVARAANEEVVIVKENDNQYIIYLKNYLNKEFQFAFSNNASELEENLNFISSALDAANENANNVAYVDSTTVALFNNPTYLWIKTSGNIEVKAREISLSDNLLKSDIAKIGKISRIIPIKLEQEVIEDVTTESGLKKTTTVGVVKINSNLANLKYQLIKRNASEEVDKLFTLAELIEKNEFTDAYTSLKASKEFLNLYDNVFASLEESKWNDVENSKVIQPEDTKTGEKYVLWLKSEEINDAHFLTSYRNENEEWVTEEIKTVLPYTYDNNITLIILGVIVVAIIVVTVRIIFLKKKENTK